MCRPCLHVGRPFILDNPLPLVQRSDMRPILKWVGGKQRLVSRLLPHVRLPPGATYYEPFAGAAALFFHLQPECSAPGDAVLGDTNHHLMCMYWAVRNSLVQVIANLKRLETQHSVEHYHEVRRDWNTWATQDETLRAAQFLYLNAACFNGMYRVNRDGDFNVPVGTKIRLSDPLHLYQASQLLKGADLKHSDYVTTTRNCESGDFIYFDPPYHGTAIGYNSDGFSDADQQTLAHRANILRNRGCRVMLSNSDTPFIRDLYSDWNLEMVTRPGTMNSNTTKRQRVPELIITHK